MTGRVCLFLLVICSPIVILVGCANEADELSSHPYFIQQLNRRLNVARESFASESPNAGLIPVLLKDMELTIEAMGRTYPGPKGEAGVAKLKEIHATFLKEVSTQVDLRSARASLKRGVTKEAVAKSIDKAYQGWQEFVKTINVKV